MFPAYYIFNSLLIMLLILHIVWTYMILKIVIDSLQKGLVRYKFLDLSNKTTDVCFYFFRCLVTSDPAIVKFQKVRKAKSRLKTVMYRVRTI